MTLVRSRPKRLLQTLDGHAALLKAQYLFSASHKLPGSKGKLREDGVVAFLKEFVSRRFDLASNVFAVTFKGNEYRRELDIVVHDSDVGGFWKLDTFGENSVCTFEGLRLVIEVKSTLNALTLADAQKKSAELSKFAARKKLSPPRYVLFAFTVAEAAGDWNGSDSVKEQALTGFGEMDAVICPDHFAYISPYHENFAFGFERGISATQAENDGSVQDEVTSRSIFQADPSRWTTVGSSPGSRLLALAAFASYAAGDEARVRGLLAASMNPKHHPIS